MRRRIGGRGPQEADLRPARGEPGGLAPDNRAKVAANAMLGRTQGVGVVRRVLAPGRAMRRGLCESADGRTRDERVIEIWGGGRERGRKSPEVSQWRL